MKENLIRNWKVVFFFSLYLAVLLICKAPDITAKCFGNDSYSLLYGAKYMEIRYPSPLFTFLGYPFANLPFGNSGGNLTLFLSTIPAFTSSIMVFLVLKKKTVDELAPWIGTATLMGSCIFFSQAIIIEVYSLLAMFLSISYCLLVYDKPKMAVVFAGFALCVHLVVAIPFYIAMVVSYDKFRKYCYVPIIVYFAIVYCYYNFVPDFYWDAGADSSLWGVLTQSIDSLGIGSGIDQIFGSLWMTVKILIIGFGLSIVPIFLAIRNRNIGVVAPLIFVIGIAVSFMVVGDWPYRYVKLAPYSPFVAILAGLGVVYIRTKYLKQIILGSSILMMISMPMFFDIGRTIDENPTAASRMYSSLNDVENGSIIVCLAMFDTGEEWVSDTLAGHFSGIVEQHNREENRDLIPFVLDIVWNSESQNKQPLLENGINIPSFDELCQQVTEEDTYMYIMEEVVKANLERDVYWYKMVDRKTERCDLTKVN